MKTCPFCAEDIQDKAIYCRYCRHDIPNSSSPTTSKKQSRSQGLVWGSLLIIFGVAGLVESSIDLTPWAWVAILAATGLGIFVVFLWDRSERWTLIPAYVLWATAGLLALVELNVLRGEFLAAYVLSAIALPFIVMFLRGR